MIGARDVAHFWGEGCAETMLSIGFAQGRASPSPFYHADKGIRTYIHGGDCVLVASEGDLQWQKAQIETKYELKTQVSGPGAKDRQEAKLPNIILRWTQQGTKYEADPGTQHEVYKTWVWIRRKELQPQELRKKA